MMGLWKIFAQKRRLLRGQKYLLQGKPLRAAECFSRYLLEEDSLPVRFNLGVAYMAAQRYDEALGIMLEIKKVPPYDTHDLLLTSLTELYFMRAEFDLAAKALEENITHNGVTPGRRYLREILLDRQKCYDRLEARKLQLLAQEYVTGKNLPKARETLEQALNLDPTDPLTWNNLGTTYLLLDKNWERAAEHFEKAHLLDPDNPRWQANYSRAIKKRRR